MAQATDECSAHTATECVPSEVHEKAKEKVFKTEIQSVLCETCTKVIE
jgi:hypothetical protein